MKLHPHSTLKEVPANISAGHVETLSPFTEFCIKGGRMGAPPAIAAAVEDVLRPQWPESGTPDSGHPPPASAVAREAFTAVEFP